MLSAKHEVFGPRPYFQLHAKVGSTTCLSCDIPCLKEGFLFSTLSFSVDMGQTIKATIINFYPHLVLKLQCEDLTKSWLGISYDGIVVTCSFKIKLISYMTLVSQLTLQQMKYLWAKNRHHSVVPSTIKNKSEAIIFFPPTLLNVNTWTHQIIYFLYIMSNHHNYTSDSAQNPLSLFYL